MKYLGVGLIWLVWGAIGLGLSYLPDQPKPDDTRAIIFVVLGVVAGILTYQVLREREK